LANYLLGASKESLSQRACRRRLLPLLLSLLLLLLQVAKMALDV
jgi:cell division protein FtsB